MARKQSATLPKISGWARSIKFPDMPRHLGPTCPPPPETSSTRQVYMELPTATVSSGRGTHGASNSSDFQSTLHTLLPAGAMLLLMTELHVRPLALMASQLTMG